MHVQISQEHLNVGGIDGLRQWPVLANQTSRPRSSPPRSVPQQAAPASAQTTRPARRRHRVLVDQAAHHRVLEQAAGCSYTPVHRRRRRTTRFADRHHPLTRARGWPGLPLQPIEHIRGNQLGPVDPGVFEEPTQRDQIERVAANCRWRVVPRFEMSKPTVADLDQTGVAVEPMHPVSPGHRHGHQRLFHHRVSSGRITDRWTLTALPDEVRPRAG